MFKIFSRLLLWVVDSAKYHHARIERRFMRWWKVGVSRKLTRLEIFKYISLIQIKMNYKIIRWMEKTVNVFRLQKPMSQLMLVTPQQFMQYLADGFILVRLARILCGNQIGPYPTGKNECYEQFYKFAKEEAKLAEGCVRFFDEES